MIDAGAIAGQLASVLGPALPYLLPKVGDTVAEQLNSALKPELLAAAKGIWARLRPSVEARPSASEAAHDVAAHPDDADSIAALRLQLKKLLAEDPQLAEELRQQLTEVPASMSVTASGERSVAVGGSVSGSSITTGDRTTRQRPERS